MYNEATTERYRNLPNSNQGLIPLERLITQKDVNQQQFGARNIPEIPTAMERMLESESLGLGRELEGDVEGSVNERVHDPPVLTSMMEVYDSDRDHRGPDSNPSDSSEVDSEDDLPIGQRILAFSSRTNRGRQWKHSSNSTDEHQSKVRKHDAISDCRIDANVEDRGDANQPQTVPNSNLQSMLGSSTQTTNSNNNIKTPPAASAPTHSQPKIRVKNMYGGEKSFTLYLQPAQGLGRHGKRFALGGAFESVIYPDVWESPALIEMRSHPLASVTEEMKAELQEQIGSVPVSSLQQPNNIQQPPPTVNTQRTRKRNFDVSSNSEGTHEKKRQKQNETEYSSSMCEESVIDIDIQHAANSATEPSQYLLSPDNQESGAWTNTCCSKKNDSLPNSEEKYDLKATEAAVEKAQSRARCNVSQSIKATPLVHESVEVSINDAKTLDAAYHHFLERLETVSSCNGTLLPPQYLNAAEIKLNTIEAGYRAHSTKIKNELTSLETKSCEQGEFSNKTLEDFRKEEFIRNRKLSSQYIQFRIQKILQIRGRIERGRCSQ